MTRRSIMNMTAHKKRDTFPLVNVNDTAKNYMQLNTGTSVFLFSPTQRLKGVNDTEHQRFTTSPFMKGYREHLELSNGNGIVWKWRRVVFESKELRISANATSGSQHLRSWNPLAAAQITTLTDILFEGTGSDWSNQFLAKTDTTRVKILSDRYRMITTPNDTTGHHVYKQYYPFERVLHYDDTEAGIGGESSFYCSGRLSGMGNVYIADFFQDVDGVEENDHLTIRCNSTLYWHER